MSPSELGFNAGALALALAVVKLSELAIRSAVAKKNGGNGQISNQRLQAIEQSLGRIATNGDHQLEALRSIERGLASNRVDLITASRERAELQKSINGLYDRTGKEKTAQKDRAG